MYKVYCDDFLLYDDSLESLEIFEPKLELELNKTGSFTFTIYSNHIYYDFIKKLKSIITVYQDDFLLFKGRVLNDEIGFYNEKHVECEGMMAYLLDSIIRPYEYSGSIEGFLQMLLDSHNEQSNVKFTLGNVTVTDANNIIVRSSTDYQITLDVIEDSLIDLLGGYIRIRIEDTNYIDYIEDFTQLSPQKVEFAKNLLDMKRIRKGEDIKTALIPLGATIEGTDERVNIKEVNDGLDYIVDEEAVKEYGLIMTTHIWDDVTHTSNLLTKGKAYLASLVKSPEVIELSAADMATIDKDIISFHLGTYVEVVSNPHGINQRFLVSKLSIDLLEPASNVLVLGGFLDSLTSKVGGVVFHGNDGKDGQDAAVLRIDSSRGTVFKNNQITTTLTVAIYYGDKRIINKSELTEAFGTSAYLEWSWQKIDENSFGLISASDSRISNEGFSLVLTPSDIDTKATFMCKLIVD